MALGAYTPPQLPHPTVPLRTFLIVEKALRMAWYLLRNNPPPGFDLTNADEDTITYQFYVTICDKVLEKGIVKGFTRDLFWVAREAKYGNYRGDEIDKMPDLIIGIHDRPKVWFRSHDGLFIECKPVDVAHPAGKDYCGKGLIRFVDGRYAWTMTEAIMIGYVCGKYSILPKLQEALVARAKVAHPNKILTTQYPTSRASR